MAADSPYEATHRALLRSEAVAHGVIEAPYIQVQRPEPPPPPSLDNRHYHLVYSGDQGQLVTHARWRDAEGAATWAAALRSPPEGDQPTPEMDGHLYLQQAGADPASGQPQRCKRSCPARDPKSGQWFPIIGRIVAL